MIAGLSFQLLIGKLRTRGTGSDSLTNDAFQLLIGKLRTYAHPYIFVLYNEFQLLIGKLRTFYFTFYRTKNTVVSTPHW